MEQRDRYDEVSALANAPAWLTFRQLLQGDAASVRKELDRIFGKGKLKLGVIEEIEQTPLSEKEETLLALALAKVHEMDVYALLDSGAAPNVVSPLLAKRLSLRTEQSAKVMNVANGDNSDVLGKGVDVPVLFEGLEARIHFIVLKNVPFDLLIGRPTLKRLGGVPDFRSEEVRLKYGGQEEVLPMFSESRRRNIRA